MIEIKHSKRRLVYREGDTRLDKCPRCGGPKSIVSSLCWACYRSPERRFTEKWRLVTNGCWEWQGCRVHGYGAMDYHTRPREAAHRISWMMFRGPIPNGLHVLHRCDNPPCVNPEHLFLGTQQDNTRDRDSKGRTPKGEQRPEAKLTADIVRGIRLDQRPNLVIAKALNIDPSTVSHVKRRRIWKHVQ